MNLSFQRSRGSSGTPPSRERYRNRPRWLPWLAAALAAVLVFGIAELASPYHQWVLRRMPAGQLRQYASLHPRDLDAAYELGVEDARVGKYKEAEDLLLRIFQKDTSRLDALNDYAVVLIAQQRYGEAIVALKGIIQARPDLPLAWANLGRLHRAIHMPFTAAGELEQAVKLDGRNNYFLKELGAAYQETLNFHSSLGAYQEALRVDPEDMTARIGLAQSYEGLSDFPRAEEAIARVLERSPNDASALFLMGDIRLKEAVSDQDVAGALAKLQKASTSDPENGRLFYDMGLALRRLNRSQEAIAPLRKALQLSPGDSSALYQLSQALIAVGQREEGQRMGAMVKVAAAQSRQRDQLEERIEQHKDDWNSRLRLARLYLEQGEYTRALLECDRVLIARPHSKDAKHLQVRAALAARFPVVAAATGISSLPHPG